MLFEVVKAPEGNSPQWVRDAWVGIEFQAQQGAPVSMPARAAGTAKSGFASILGSASSGPDVSERRGYSVNARELLGLLALHNTEAAEWYLNNAPQMLDPKQVFLFDENCCHAIANLSGR